MLFIGISKQFSLVNEDQYNTISAFWDEMALLYGLENLQGLGYNWKGNTMEYAIGLKNGDIKDYNLTINLPDNNWIIAKGNKLKEKAHICELFLHCVMKLFISNFFYM